MPNDFHHFNPNLDTNALELHTTAIACLKQINTIEMDVFSYKFEDGKLVPTNLKYWPTNQSDKTQVECFIRNIP